MKLHGMINEFGVDRIVKEKSNSWHYSGEWILEYILRNITAGDYIPVDDVVTNVEVIAKHICDHSSEETKLDDVAYSILNNAVEWLLK